MDVLQSRVAGRWNVVAEAAAKVVVRDAERLVSTGSNDYGTQISLQRHFRRNALYLSVAQVWVSLAPIFDRAGTVR